MRNTKPQLGVFPNPTNGITHISYPLEADGIGTIDLFDGTGKLIASNALKGKGVLEMDMSKQPIGIYLIRLRVAGKSVAECKLIVQ